MAGAGGTPIDKHGVRVPPYLFGQHGVVRHRDRVVHAVRDSHVYYQDLTDARKYFHHLIELLGAKGAVVAYVDNHNVSELAGRAPLPEDADSGRGLEATLYIDDT